MADDDIEAADLADDKPRRHTLTVHSARHEITREDADGQGDT